MRWYLGKIQSCTIVLINNFEILQVSIAFFSDTVRPRNLKFFLYINPYGYSLQTKFHVARSPTFREKCNDTLKLASHFSPILYDRETWNFFCILTHMDTLCKPNFMFLGRTLFEKKCDDNLKLASHFYTILCDRGTWNLFCVLTHMDTLCKPNFMFLGRTLFEKNAMITCKNSKLHNCPNKQLWNFTR